MRERTPRGGKEGGAPRTGWGSIGPGVTEPFSQPSAPGLPGRHHLPQLSVELARHRKIKLEEIGGGADEAPV
jgi:hypothetical protein